MRITLASGITLVRLALLPPIVLLLIDGRRWPAFALLLVVLLGDLADGALARMRGEVSELGKLLDPIVDKLVFLVVFAALVWVGDLHWWTLGLLGGLYLGILIGGLFWLKGRGDPPPARPLGKWSSFAISLGVLATLLKLPLYHWLVYGGLALAYLAGVDYLINMLRVMRGDSRARAPRGRAGIPLEEER
jgi:phosphatidylglycerophosphate synthase